MSASRARKIMLAAIVLSLLLHLILAGYIRWPFNQPSQQNEIVKIRRITIAHAVPHTPPPTPPPTPVPTPRVTAAPTSKVVPPHVTTRTAKGPPIAHAVAPSSGPRATAAATQAPTPAATAVALACMQHDITPAVTATPQPVDIPPDARASKASGVAAIQVQLDAQGHVTNTSVAKSSGSTALDAVAIALAKGATYSPALVKCKPVAAAYTFTVKFSPW